jgi:hypothetical protein
MPRNNLLVVVGVALVLAFVIGVSWDPKVGAFLGALAITGFRLSRAFGGLDASPVRGPEPDPDQMIGRHQDAEGPQLAGSKCAYCAQKILTSTEAVACRVCKAPVHVHCRKDHRRDAHRKESGAPYR